MTTAWIVTVPLAVLALGAWLASDQHPVLGGEVVAAALMLLERLARMHLRPPGRRLWANAQRREREAYPRAEAIKKIAETQGEPPEPVMALLSQALKPPPALLSPAQAREFYRGEVVKRMAKLKGSDADAALALMREDEKRSARRVREGLKLGGLISASVGVGFLVFLRAIIPGMPVYLAGLIPLLVGCALLVYALVLASTE
jgi:hypothetical protein